MIEGAVPTVLGGFVSTPVVGISVLAASVAVDTVAGLEIASHSKSNKKAVAIWIYRN